MHTLALINPMSRVDGTRTSVRIASSQDISITGYGGNRWVPAISQPGQIDVQLFDGDFSSQVSAAQLSMNLSIEWIERFWPGASAWRWEGAAITVQSGSTAASMPIVFSGVVESFERNGGTVRLTAKASSAPGETKVLSQTYAGTTGLEGIADIKGRSKPWLLGVCWNVEPVLIDNIDNVYQFSAYGPIKAVTKLYERGADFGVSLGNYANYAALVAATIPEGRWATCLAQGLVRLGAPQAGVITADVEGDYTGGTLAQTTGAVLQRIASVRSISSATIDSPSLAALDSFSATLPSGGVIGIYITDDIGFLDLARQLCLPLNAQAGYTPTGKLFAARVVIGSPTFTIDGLGRQLPVVSNLVEQDTKPPFKRIVMGGARSWRVHDLSTEIAFALNLIDRGDWSVSETYREGNIVTMPDGSRWVYSNATASSGNVPSAGSAYWDSLSSAVQVTYRDATPPDNPQIGWEWINPATGRRYRFEGSGLLVGGAPITTGGTPWTVGGWIEIQSDAIGYSFETANAAASAADQALQQIENLADDGIISVAEKVTVLIPRSAVLEAAYTELVAVATSLGVSTTAVTAARTAWLDYRDDLIPLWDDIDNDTPVVRDDFRDAVDDYEAELEALAAAISEAASYSLSVTPPSIVLTGDYLAVVSGDQFPVVITPRVLSGAMNVNATTIFDFTAGSGITATQNTTASDATRGTVTVTAVTGDGAVTITAQGQTVSIPITVRRAAAPPPVTGSGGAVTSSSITTYPSVTATSFLTNPPTVATITAPSSGQVQFSGSWDYGGNGVTLEGKHVYRVAGSGGSWIDVAAATNGTTSVNEQQYLGNGEFENVREPGNWSQTATVSGLTAGTNYEWGVSFRRSAGSGTVTPSGASTAAQA